MPYLRLARTVIIVLKSSTYSANLRFFRQYPLTSAMNLFIFGSFGQEIDQRTTGVVAQFWLEHRPVTPEVASSSLVYPAKKTFERGSFLLFHPFFL